eukprot:3959971-Pleurochrysis_carterae.AAC.1
MSACDGMPLCHVHSCSHAPHSPEPFQQRKTPTRSGHVEGREPLLVSGGSVRPCLQQLRRRRHLRVLQRRGQVGAGVLRREVDRAGRAASQPGAQPLLLGEEVDGPQDPVGARSDVVQRRPPCAVTESGSVGRRVQQQLQRLGLEQVRGGVYGGEARRRSPVQL